MHSAGLELTKLTYTRLEDNLGATGLGVKEPPPFQKKTTAKKKMRYLYRATINILVRSSTTLPSARVAEIKKGILGSEQQGTSSPQDVVLARTIPDSACCGRDCLCPNFFFFFLRGFFFVLV